jgi:hypothetical protein
VPLERLAQGLLVGFTIKLIKADKTNAWQSSFATKEKRLSCTIQAEKQK